MDELRSFGFVLKDVSRLYVQRFEEHARSLGLTLSQCKVLVYLADNEGVSQARLGELAEIEPMNLVRILDHMESEGWLERRVDPSDRRARQLFMKSKAKPMVEDIWSVSQSTREEIFAGIPRQQAKSLITLLEKIRENILSLDPLPVVAPVSAALGGHARGKAGDARARRMPARAKS
jgi:MarR family transcriptional regulator, transcriptional regulator for hemolysin